MRNVTAYGVQSPGAPIEKMTIARRDLGPRDVLVAIAFVGICHSDIHSARGEWEWTKFPLVPGHEITGVVEGVGADVRAVSTGDRVGVGVIVDSCGRCARCLRGDEQYCLDGVTETYNSIGRDGQRTFGGYSTHIVADEHFVYRIPTPLSMEEAAPLLCAGITVYSPLRRWGAAAGRRVGVVGIGGLGHMAVKIASALGCEVLAISRSSAKRSESLRLGASQHLALGEDDTREHDGTLDLVINTAANGLDLDACLSLLTIDGILVNLGLPAQPLELSAGSLIVGRRSIAGSMIGGVGETRAMLDFCAEHGLGADVETVRATQIAQAWDRVERGDVRYRFVIDASSI